MAINSKTGIHKKAPAARELTMDAKTIARNPDAAMAATWGSAATCPVRGDVLQLSGDLAALTSDIKRIKQSKGELARQFKNAKQNPQQFAALKRQMTVISAQLTDREQQRKTLEAQLLRHFSQADTPSHAAPFPARFRHRTFPIDDPGEITVTPVNDSDAKAWDAYVTSHPASSLYHLYAWRHVITQAFGHPCHYFTAKKSNGQWIGILPVVSINSRLFGHYAVSMPFFNYGGILADSATARDALLHRARDEARRHGWQHVEYRTCEEGLGLPSSSRKVSMILRLPPNEQTLDKALGAKVRAQFKQAHRLQPSIAFGGMELLDHYYQVFSRNMRDLGTPVYSKVFFETILQALPDHCTIVVVTVGRKPVAAAFLAGYKEMLEIPWASTLRKYNEANINMWMYREILGYAVEENYQFFDFGRSTEGAGTYHFKKQWGAKPLRHYWYYELTSAQQTLPALNPDNSKYRFAIAAWKRLPLFLANSLGPRIVKNLP